MEKGQIKQLDNYVASENYVFEKKVNSVTRWLWRRTLIDETPLFMILKLPIGILARSVLLF